MRRSNKFLYTLFVCCLLTYGYGSKARAAASQEETSSPPQTLPSRPFGQVGEWNLIFHDEFESDALNAEKWVTCYWWDDDGCTIETNNELQWYQPGNV